MTVHFVYAWHSGASVLSKIRRRALTGLRRLGVNLPCYWRRDRVNTSEWPSTSPCSITSHVYAALGSRWNTLLYDNREHMVISGGPHDVLIGHPAPNDHSAVWNRSCVEGQFQLRIALFPLHHRMVEINAGVDQYIKSVDSIIGIMGQYWYDTWRSSALAHWYPKITRLDMALDVAHYPRVKQRFNPPGKRKFFFIGNGDAYKGLHLLAILFGLTDRHRCVSIGSKHNWTTIDCRGWQHLTPKYMQRVATECDMFLTCGVSDANPTTILESLAWGFPVCCTPQSGYYRMAEIGELSTTDMRRNLELLDYYQSAPEDVLIDQANRGRALVEEAYTWGAFTQKVVDTIETQLRAKRPTPRPGQTQTPRPPQCA